MNLKQNFMYTEGGGFNPVRLSDPDQIEFLVIDLFCGAGGTSTGFHNAKLKGNQCALVIACINHDHNAIKSHWSNYPDVVHFEEDIRTVKLEPLAELLDKYRVLYPNAKVILWASLECTNFSKAKGGQPRDADSRTLAEHLDRYILSLDPDYIQIENVVEFMSWGPLDEKGKPVSRRSGSDWLKWCAHIDSLGYRNEWREMNSADYGAYTSRNRLFGCFAKPGLPIVWPQSTHAKKPGIDGLFGAQHKWKAVKDVLDLQDEGESIFNRKKPLVDASLERIYAGLIKFVAGGKEAFILKYNSSNGNGRHNPPGLDEPCPVIACQNRLGVIQTKFIAKYFSGRPAGKVIPVSGPAGAITTVGGQTLVSVQPFILNTNFKNQASSINEPSKTLLASRHHPYVLNPVFLTKYYGNGDSISSVNDPAGTITTKDRFTKVQPVFIEKTFTGNGNNRQIQSINDPAGTIMPNDKHRVIHCQPFILNPSHGGHCTGTEVPAPVIIARQDKSPLYLIQFETHQNVSVPVYEDDTEVMIRIKRFMALYSLSDIKMRMLKVSELILIQGFPVGYKLEGNQTDQKKFIGNSVVPAVVTAWCEVMASRNRELRREVA